MLSSVVSVLSVLLGSVLAVKAPSYQRDQGGDDPYPIQRYIGTKQSLHGTNSGPQAMSHERDRNGPGSVNTGRPIPKESHFEPLFDDFPGPKTKQRIYYPGKGYVEMQVPVQQPDPYSDGKPKNYQSGTYDSARYNTGAYDSARYNTGGYDASSDSGSYSPPVPQRSYSPPAQSYNSRPQPSYSAPAQPANHAPLSPTDLAHEDDDSPFDYMTKKGAGGSSIYGGQASSYSSAPAPGYHAPLGPPAPAYRPSPPAMSYKSNNQPAPPNRPPAPRPSYSSGQSGDAAAAETGAETFRQTNGKSFFSYNENRGNPYTISQKPDVSIVTGGAGGYSGGNDDGEVGLQSYNPPLPSNPSGYKPSGSYPSSYPDTKSASMFSESAVDRDQRNQRDPSDGLSNSFGARSLAEGPRPNGGNDAHSRGFYDLAEQSGAPRSDQGQPGLYRN